MARTDQDNTAKQSALKYCVSSGFIPFLEVDVHTGFEFSTSPKLITDIDVLGVHIRDDGTHSRTIFDCKSTGGPAFARALWLSGLMTFVGVDEGMILMGKPAERAHKLAARKLNVRLFGSNSFERYALASDPEFGALKSYPGALENWLRLFDAFPKNPAVGGIYKIVQQEVPLTQDPARSFRRLISRVLEFKGELNPAKPLHMATFVELVTSVSMLLGMITGQLRNLVDLSDGEKEYSSVLRYYLWGGHDGVTTLRRMYELMGAANRESEAETSLVAWPQFVQVTRTLLEAPTLIRNSTIALRELSLRYMADLDYAADQRVGRLFSTPRARQFAKRIGSYTAAVAKLPPEFSERLDKQIDELVATVNRPHL